MSRMGRKPIELDDRVKVTAAGSEVTIAGPKGSLTRTLPACVRVRQAEKRLLVECDVDSRETSALYGMARSLIQGMVTGVSEGYKKSLELQGVGYRAQCSGQKITMTVGFSHPVEFNVPQGVKVTLPDQTHIILEGVDKHLVGHAASSIRAIRPPDAYKGKGIRYVGEQITLKEGKTVG